MSVSPIYCDHNATTPLCVAAEAAMVEVYRQGLGNPASAHRLGRSARRIMDEAREQIAHHLHCHPDELTFTSGATEANNLAIFGSAGAEPGSILATRLEHPCVIEPILALEKKGWSVNWLDPKDLGNGFIEHWVASLSEKVNLATLMLANHETGQILPIQALRERTPTAIPFHCDAAQAVGKIPVDFQRLGVSTLSFSAHKFGGPPGIGALIVRQGWTLRPHLFGGHQQRGLRPGTEAIALVVGMATALTDALNDWERKHLHLDNLRQRFLEVLTAQGVNYHLNSPRPGEPTGLANTLNLAFPGHRAELLLMKLDLQGVCCSAGSACSSGSLLASPVLLAQSHLAPFAESSLRFSFAVQQTLTEIEDAAKIVAGAVSNPKL